MDLSLLPTSLSQYNKQRTGSQFTVRSANSPSYSLTRRPGIRKRDTPEDVGERGRHGTHASTNAAKKEKDGDTGYQPTARNSCVKDQNKEKDATGSPAPTTLNSETDKTTTESGTDGREKAVFERQGRTECRRYNLPSRSMSLDWRTGAKSPVRGSRADMSMLSTKTEADLSGHLGCFEEKRTVTEIVMMGDVPSSLHGYKSAGATHVQDRSSVNHTSRASDKISRGNSLPSKIKSESGPSSRFTEILGGVKGGQTIQERIEKLYGSAGEKAASFPRRLSVGENRSSVQSKMPFIWPQKDTNTSGWETSLSQETSTAREKSAAGHWQGQIHNRYSDEFKWGKATIETGTKSLDRARSRYTIAAQIRSARAQGAATEIAKPSSFVEKTFKDSGLREGRVSGGKEDDRQEYREEKTSNINEMSNEISGRVKAQEKENKPNERAKEQTVQKIVSDDEDVFETNPQTTTSKTAERKKLNEILSVPTADSVRNRINQFEAMTQRATGPAPLPRRTFSVPTQFSKGFHGVKKSGSAKEISRQRDMGEEVKEVAEGKKPMEGGKKLPSERSLSVDEVGLRLGKMETRGNDLSDVTKNNFSEVFNKYSRLKETLYIPLNEGAQRQSKKSYLDETDFSKVSSPEESSRKNTTANNEPSPPASCVQPRQHCESASPDSDDDKTPTRLPDNSPFISPPPQPENGVPTAKNKNENVSVFTQADKSEDSAFPSLSLPAATSSLPDLPFSDIKTVSLKGNKYMRDLSAWVAGSNPEYIDNDQGGYEDDDESTQVDEDSNYDSDSGDSSVTITSNMSHSDRRSFSLSLSELCNFAGPDYDSDDDNREWQPTGRRSVSLSSDISDLSVFSSVSMLPTEELDKLLEDVKSLGDDTLQDYEDVQVVVLHKEVGVGLGFSLAGGVDQNKPITVHKVFHAGVAAQEGSIREGDQILSINGTALSGSAHLEVLRVLKKAKARNMGVVVLRRGDVSSPIKKGVQENNEEETQTQYETGQRVCVQLQKNGRDLGFSLQGGVGTSEGNRPLTVQKIFQGGPVDKVCPGDEVLEIKGMSMVGMRRLEVWTFIKTLPSGPVEVVLHRPVKHLQT